MTLAQIEQLKKDFLSTTLRAEKAGYDIIEIHAAHGYLLHSFLSPFSNKRNDQYGGDRAGRSRLLIEIAAELRAAWPADKPLFVRLSAVDDLEGGWDIDDSIWLSVQLKALGVDVIDCSSGGIIAPANAPGAAAIALRTKRVPGFGVPWARAIKHGAKISTMTVGLILDGEQAEQIAASGDADLVAIGREALDDPNWPLHAAQQIKADTSFSLWPVQFGWWLNVRHGMLAKLRLGKF
jgi:2,4-dienoyl-CoA reductase-like NADH-dependent reductase (Old Yellow Enzyme family)